MWSFKWFVLLIIVGKCSYPSPDRNIDFIKIHVEGSEIVINSESNAEIAYPSFMRTALDYFLIYDANLQKIFKYNYKGGQLLSFGRKGRGPGEFQSLTNYWIMNDHYLLYDYNGAKMVRYSLNGAFIDEYVVNNFDLTPVIEAVSTDKFIYPAKGEGGSLLKISDVSDGQNNKVVHFGEAVAEEEEESSEDIRNAIRRGQIPNYMKNSLFLGANESGIFSFLSANALLQKYSVDGEFIWEKDLNIPSVDGVFDHFLKQNQEQEFIFSLTYAHDMHVNEYGTAVLLNTIEDKPTTVAWIPNDGKNIRIIEFSDIDRHPLFGLRFRVAPGQNAIFFINGLEGKVFRSHWPIR